jgi:hypothetical protein
MVSNERYVIALNAAREALDGEIATAKIDISEEGPAVDKDIEALAKALTESPVWNSATVAAAVAKVSPRPQSQAIKKILKTPAHYKGVMESLSVYLQFPYGNGR